VNGKDVIVVGGGVAGIAAAVTLADAGASVLLLEQRRLLGGRAGSFAHALGPEGLLDNAQHVLLGCCTELGHLYNRLGVADLIRFDEVLRFAAPGGRRAQMRAVLLPAPLHLAPSMLWFGLLNLRQKIEIGRAMATMMVEGEVGREQYSDISFGAYLRDHGQSDDTIRAFWDVITVSALNEPCIQASAKYGMQVFQEGFLNSRGGYRLGYARAPLSRLYENLDGVTLRPSAQVRELVLESGRVTGVDLAGGERLSADQVVLAVSPGGAIPLLRAVCGLDERLRRIEQIAFRPILGAHLLFDRPVRFEAPVALMGTTLQWAFVDQQRPELVHGVVSAADLLPDGVDLAQLFVSELQSIFPEMAGAVLADSVMVKERRATFRPVPGVDRLRPGQRTRVPGLTLAGDYTQTSWPATMEGAARSGKRAAEVILHPQG
jgi:squalene-associated FAD-dependent desaturase